MPPSNPAWQSGPRVKQLGFESFMGDEAFTGAERRAAQVCDADVAQLMVDLLRANGPKTFIFAIPMENHAPWSGAARFDRDFAPDLPPMKDDVAFRNYMNGVASADGMIQTLSHELLSQGDNGLLGFYGDHLPNLTGVCSSLNFRSRRSDYFLWRPDGGDGQRKDLAAHNLADDIWNAQAERLCVPQPALKPSYAHVELTGQLQRSAKA